MVDLSIVFCMFTRGYPSRGMDAGAAKYLEDNVGGVLAKALAEMAKVQPKDALMGGGLSPNMALFHQTCHCLYPLVNVHKTMEHHRF